MRFVRKLVDNRDAGSLAVRLRRRRFRLFGELTADLARPVSVLDVGGTESYWRTMGVTGESGYRVVLLNRTAPPASLPFVEAQVGDATDLSRFGDGSFDVVFSNSVIEHVGDLDAQRRMAGEVMRVGRRYYVQTPNRHFPIEPHFLMPYFQYWPRGLQVAMLRRFDLGWYKRTPDEAEAREAVESIRLLTEPELRRLFPDAAIHRERMFGMTKSLVACGRARFTG